MTIKTSIRYFNKTPIRSIWDDDNKKWLYAAVDVVTALINSNNPRIYWNSLKRRNPELFTNCIQLKLTARDGKKYLTDVIPFEDVTNAIFRIRSNNSLEFSKWINGLSNPIDEQSRVRAYELYDNSILKTIVPGSVDGLIKIHSYLFEGLYPFAGKIRSKNISKNGFIFANCMFLPQILEDISKINDNSFDDIIKKYIEMNIAHPFMEGNGRATRIWLDVLLKNKLGVMIDWSKIDKKTYLTAMEESTTNPIMIRNLISNALTNDINNHEIFMKGIDYSYYYEEID